MKSSPINFNSSPFSPRPEYRSDRPFRTLLSLYRQDGRNLGLSMLFYVIKHSPEWIRPLVFANVINILSNPNTSSLRDLWLNGVVLAAAMLQNIPTHYLHIRFISAAIRKMEFNLRLAIAQRLQELSLGFYQKNNTGAIQAKLMQDVEAIQVLTYNIFQFLPSTLLTIIVAIAVTAIRATWFLLFFAATVPIAAVLIQLFKEPIHQRNSVLRQKLESLSAYLFEMIKLIPITRAHGIEAIAIERTETQLKAVQQAAIRVDSINAITNASSWVILQVFGCLCLMTSATLVYTGRWGITVGDVILLTAYFDALTNSIVQIMTVLPQLGKGFEAIRSVGEILESPDLEANQGKIPVQSLQGSFKFDSVSFAYPGTEQLVLKDLSLQVKAGEMIAIVGPSGAGKSTLLNLLIGLLRPTQGRILLDGQEFNTLDLRTYRRFISVVSQETILFQGTVRENILYGLDDIEEKQLQQAIESAYAWEFIAQLPQGLNTLIGENGVKLSGGQRQRIAIARALIRNPCVLILDEATAALDAETEALIQESLQGLSGRTIFWVTHRFSTIRKADRIVVLEKGSIVEVGTFKQLLANQEMFARLNALQSLED